MRWLRGRAGEVTVSIAFGFGIVIGCVAIGVSAVSYRVAKNVPMIHDITTDPSDPPAFVALLPERNGSFNGAEYGGAVVAEKQRKAYPDIVPIESSLPPAESFERALDVARGMGWAIAGADPAAGRIEATDRTRWLKLKDDVVIRIRPEESGSSRVDVRSVSRIGLSDLGRNAARIREFSSRYAGALHLGL
ncbi:MAG TPA: DUF1499 domain-containing protein [Candidatus Deferrimicrobiaceae bacterium]